MQLKFDAPEYQADGQFQLTAYHYQGNPETGWQIRRKQQPYLQLGPGYQLVETQFCGICATDLYRQSLPFALPQITGHEIAGLYHHQPVTVEINDTHFSRGHRVDTCPYCQQGLDRHCPTRLTIGIDRLPGGFAPYILAPQQAIIPLPTTLPLLMASITEPFAAALRALEITPPDQVTSVAVLGPRRLGMLLLTALAAHRQQYQLSYRITAVLKHKKWQSTCLQLGADEILLLDDKTIEDNSALFDIVYDTTGSPQGFNTALDLSRHKVHIKSTHGQSVLGLQQWSNFVVDELTLAPYFTQLLPPISIKRPLQIYLADHTPMPCVKKLAVTYPDAKFFSHQAAITKLQNESNNLAMNHPIGIQGFDIVVINTIQAMDSMIHTDHQPFTRWIRPGGLILLAQPEPHSLVEKIWHRGLSIESSRCGRFEQALAMFKANPALLPTLESHWLSHTLSIDNIQQAFHLAADSQQSIKIILQTQT